MNQWAAVSACGAGEQLVKCVCPLANVQYDRIPVQPRLCPKVVVFFLIFGSDGAFGLQNTIQYIKIQYIHYEGCSSLAEKV